jgi:hypothetical protein
MANHIMANQRDSIAASIVSSGCRRGVTAQTTRLVVRRSSDAGLAEGCGRDAAVCLFIVRFKKQASVARPMSS